MRYIVENKKNDLKKLTVVFHGAGEPTYQWQQMVDTFNNISALSEKYKLPIFTYIATNGFLTESQIDWLAENIDLIGISCDGPKTIQKRQRLLNTLSYPSIEMVCQRILEKGGQFYIRTTITPDSISDQLDIVRFLIKECNARNIQFEPAYLLEENGFDEKHAELYFNEFIKAKKYAEKAGVILSYAGVRLDELHGTYCDVSRRNLRLTPDGFTRNCFCFMKNEAKYITGHIDHNLSLFELKTDIDELKKKASQIPVECTDCINVFHCSRGCPDFCIFDIDHSSGNNLNPFRCHLHKLFAVEQIKSMVENTSESD